MVAVSPARMSRAREANEKSTKGEGEGEGACGHGARTAALYCYAAEKGNACWRGPCRDTAPTRRFRSPFGFWAALGTLEQRKGRKGKEARWKRAKFEDSKKVVS